MRYQTIHKAYETYELTVMWVLLGAFATAMALMFVHPTGAIAVLFAGMIGLGLATVFARLMLKRQHAAAQRALRVHVCPVCGIAIDRDARGTWHCHECDASFIDSGAEEAPGGP